MSTTAINEKELRVGDRVVHHRGAEFMVIATAELKLPEKTVTIFRLLPTVADGELGLMEDGPLLSVDARGLSGFTLRTK